MPKREFGGVDILRFCAAFVVAIFHLGFWVWAVPQGQSGRAAGAIPPFQPLAVVGEFGWVGVEIFFVISGFVIAFSAARATPGMFAWRRFLRLAPAVWIVAPVSAFAALAAGSIGVRTACRLAMRSMLFLPFGPWADQVYWTLAIEIIFYVSIYLLLLARRFDLIEIYAALLGLVGLCFWAAFFLVPNTGLDHSRTLDLLLVHHGAYFALGIMIWASSVRGVNVARATVIVIAIAAAMMEILARTEYLRAETGGRYMPGLANLVWLAALAAMMLSVRFPIGGRGLRTLGLMTYPLYLLHNVAGSAAMGGMIRGGMPPYLALAATVVLVLAASWFVAVVPEPWLRATMARLTAARRARLADA